MPRSGRGIGFPGKNGVVVVGMVAACTEDPLAAFEAAGAKERQARRDARRTPARRAQRSRGRIQRQRGYQAERLVESVLAPYGFQRVPLSGQLGGSRYAGDLRGADQARAIFVVECKRRQGCDRTLRAQLSQGNADCLVRVPGGGQEPLVVVTLAKLTALLGEAGYAPLIGRETHQPL